MREKGVSFGIRLLVLAVCVTAGGVAAAQDISMQEAGANLQRPLTATACSIPVGVREIALDAFGNPAGDVGTPNRPAYVGGDESERVGFRYEPTLDADPRRGDLLPLTIELDPMMPLALEPGRQPTFSRRDLLMRQDGGVAKLEVKKEGRTVSAIWIIPYSSDTIVLDENGPVDPAYRNSTAPVFFPCAPRFLYVPTKTGAANAPTSLSLEVADQFFEKLDAGNDAHTIDRTRLAPLRRDKEVQLAVVKNGRGIAAITLTDKEPEKLPEPPSVRNGVTIYPIVLDRSGISSWPYLNRRRPPLVRPGPDAYLRFRNTVSDREFVVTFGGISESERAELIRRGVEVGGCRNGTCQASFRVTPNGGQVDIPVTPLRNAYVKSGVGSVATFQVSFFDDDMTPTNSRGYLTFVDAPYVAEPQSLTAWTAGVSGATAYDPDLTTRVPKGQKAPRITFGTPWRYRNRFHVSGSATVGLKQTLGSRADAEFEFTAKRGDFGQEASAVQPSKYLANVNALYGLVLTIGKMDLAAPTNGIALFESGESINAAFPLGTARFSAGGIFRKQLPDGSFTVEEEKKAIDAGGSDLERRHVGEVYQLRDVWLGRVRTSFYRIAGRSMRGQSFTADPAATPPALVRFNVDYQTTGVDAMFAVRNLFVSGGVYGATRSSNAPAFLGRTGDATDGYVGLVNVSYSKPTDKTVQGKREVAWTASGSIGAGGEYVGETQSFTPDVLFLSIFAPALPFKDPAFRLGTGLTNKTYYGATWSSSRPGLTEALAKFVHLPPSDISNVGITLKAHHYRLRGNAARGENLGTEGSAEVRVDSPKGVRYQLTVAGFQPGPALKGTTTVVLPLVTKFQVLARLNVTIRFAE